MDLAREFRVFIHKGRIVAVSQYDFAHVVWSPEEVTDLSAVMASVFCLLERLRVHVRYSNCIMGVFVPRHEAVAKLLEFNPWGPELSSGACLFDWVADQSCLYADDEQHVPVVRVTRAPLLSANETASTKARCLIH